MLGKIYTAIAIAFQNIKSNPLHTFLSTLGMIIGVAALVAILSLADGIEQYAREQITKTTSLKAIAVKSKTTERVDDVKVQLQDFPIITPDKYEKFKNELGKEMKSVHLESFRSDIVSRIDSSLRVGVRYKIVTKDYKKWDDALAYGAGFDRSTDGILISLPLAKKMINIDDPEQLVGKKIMFRNRKILIQGILNEKTTHKPFALIPFSLFNRKQLRSSPPVLMAVAHQVEDVSKIKKAIEKWLDASFDKGATGFRIIENRQRLKQAQTGIRIFKIIMGLITGIAVLVGGIGIMNVLLITVKERTKEIGIRKAAGAKKRDIGFQFLSESIVISSLGSILGLITGMLLSLLAIPIVNYLVDAKFRVAYTPATFLIIAILAVVVGIVFGTYPALKAARLTPVDAIRYE